MGRSLLRCCGWIAGAVALSAVLAWVALFAASGALKVAGAVLWAGVVLSVVLLGGHFCIRLGGQLLADEQQTGRLDLMLSYPLSRRRILFEKLAMLLVCAAALGVTAGGGLLLANRLVWGSYLSGAHVLFADPFLPGDNLRFVVNWFLLFLNGGYLALALGAAGLNGRTSRILAWAGLGSFLTGYLLPRFLGWELRFSFNSVAVCAGLAGAALISVVAAWYTFERRDVA